MGQGQNKIHLTVRIAIYFFVLIIVFITIGTAFLLLYQFSQHTIEGLSIGIQNKQALRSCDYNRSDQPLNSKVKFQVDGIRLV